MNLGLAEWKHRVRQAAIRIYNHKVRFDKRRQLQRHGYQALADVSEALMRSGAVCFADFGTLLGIVRDGGIMAHDLDLDFGVLRPVEANSGAVREQLSAIGCKLWRSHSVAGKIATESYNFPCANGDGGIKFDVNYYDVEDHHCRTWLFYRDPKQRYGDCEMSVVEMTYDRIDAIEVVDVKGHAIPIPRNADKVLEQKYGAGWRKPDRKWIYWQSPAARPLPGRERYVSHPDV